MGGSPWGWLNLTLRYGSWYPCYPHVSCLFGLVQLLWFHLEAFLGSLAWITRNRQLGWCDLMSYPLANVYITMENHHFSMGKSTINGYFLPYFWPLVAESSVMWPDVSICIGGADACNDLERWPSSALCTLVPWKKIVSSQLSDDGKRHVGTIRSSDEIQFVSTFTSFSSPIT